MRAMRLSRRRYGAQRALLAALSLLASARSCLGATREAFTRGAVNAALQPWASPSRRVSEADMTQRLADVVAGGLRAQVDKRIVGVLLHAGTAWVTTGPLRAEQLRRTPFLRLLRDAAAAAQADPQLSAELLLHFGDSQVNALGANVGAGDALAARVPVFAVDRWVNRADIPVPNYYVQPDEACAAGERKGDEGRNNSGPVPWSRREARLLGRDTMFCQQQGEALQPFPVCQREHFARLAQRLGAVGAVTLDVAPTNALDRLPDIQARPAVAPAELSAVKYLLVTAGITGAGKLANALASGAVVLLPRSFAHAYYEHALVPYTHFVPLWARGVDDDLADAVAWLEAEPAAAAAIAAAGRRFACAHLRAAGRAAYWRELLRRYAATVLAYRVDDALMARRNATVPLLRVTAETLQCDALAAGNGCSWLGAGEQEAGAT